MLRNAHRGIAVPFGISRGYLDNNLETPKTLVRVELTIWGLLGHVNSTTTGGPLRPPS